MAAAPHAAIVARHFPGARLRTSEQLTGGVSADVYRLDVQLADGSERPIVLRIHGPTHGGHELTLEFELLSALHRAGLPVPDVLAMDASRTLLEHPYLLMEFVEGATSFPPDEADRRIDMMAEALGAVHATPLPGLPALPERRDVPIDDLQHYLPAGAEWRDLREGLAAVTIGTFEGAPALCHGDFWPTNILWRDGRIVAILDWEDCAIGDPHSDVATACLELRYLFGAAGAARFKHAYERHRALEPTRFAHWQVYVAAAAQHFMGKWRLEKAREDHMRRTALSSIREASAALRAGTRRSIDLAFEKGPSRI